MRYYPTAALLGLGWFGVLLVPTPTREWLLEPDAELLNLLALLGASVLTAGLFRGWIASAQNRRANLLRAISIPWVGCVIYLTLYNGYAGTMDFLSIGRINTHDSLVLYFWGLLYTLLCGYVVLPYSFFCQWLLNKTGKTGKSPA